MSLNSCLDIKWASIVFLSYFWIYSCPLMHAWILNGLTLFSFHHFCIIHVPYCMLRYQMGLASFPIIIFQLFMSLNACSDIKWAYIVFLSYIWNYSCPLMHARIYQMGLHCFPFILLELFMSLNAFFDIKWAYIVFLSYFWNYSCLLMHDWILNGLTLFSFGNFAIIHAP